MQRPSLALVNECKIANLHFSSRDSLVNLLAGWLAGGLAFFCQESEIDESRGITANQTGK